ncbi:hypothetical protein [Emticicia sp. C21]|uniref:hypothetical protein n=1 Tax=Emticicia sp. C21 TaxID=2302915 RepID=UPI000E344206|nr:hypothetical protein [Emticicia sp. C21]RFS15745.1 hypothetical protein D0T08_16535 [Emticicia sp. C21]
MQVKSLIVDIETENSIFYEKIENPTLQDVLQSVDRLNGKDITMLNLLCKEENHLLCVGGGKEDYILFITFDNENFDSLCDESKSSSKEKELIIGGQLGEYPENLCNSKPEVIKAITYFFETGKPNPALSWIKE